MSRWTILMLLLGWLGASAVTAVEESEILAWAGAGEELGTTLACQGLGAVLGAPGSGGTGDRFFLGVFDPQAGFWVNVDEISAGNSFVRLAMSATNVAALLDDAVETYTWGPTGLVPLETVTGVSPRAVAIGNDSPALLAVGRHHNSFPVSHGTVTTYSRSGSWEFEDSFLGEVTYGFALSMDQNKVAVGQQGSTVSTGEAWILTRSLDEPHIWTECCAKTAPNSQLNNSFGAALALDGGSWAVGAPFDDHGGGVDAGSVHLYRASCGSGDFLGDGVLISPDPVPGGRFGASVALVGNDLVVGEPGAGTPAHPLAGAAHLYRRGPGGWAFVETMTRFMPGSGDELGTSVCISEHGVLVGAPFADRMGPDSGVVLFYRGLNTLFADGFECGDTGDWSTTTP